MRTWQTVSWAWDYISRLSLSVESAESNGSALPSLPVQPSPPKGWPTHPEHSDVARGQEKTGWAAQTAIRHLNFAPHRAANCHKFKGEKKPKAAQRHAPRIRQQRARTQGSGVHSAPPSLPVHRRTSDRRGTLKILTSWSVNSISRVCPTMHSHLDPSFGCGSLHSPMSSPAWSGHTLPSLRLSSRCPGQPWIVNSPSRTPHSLACLLVHDQSTSPSYSKKSSRDLHTVRETTWDSTCVSRLTSQRFWNEYP